PYRGLRRVGVGGEASAHERVDDTAALVLGQVDVSGRLDDPAENRPGAVDVLPEPDARADVPVLEHAPAAGVDTNPGGSNERDRPVGDGVDGRAVRRGDVDALVEREAPRAVEHGREGRRAHEDAARVAE